MNFLIYFYELIPTVLCIVFFLASADYYFCVKRKRPIPNVVRANWILSFVAAVGTIIIWKMFD